MNTCTIRLLFRTLSGIQDSWIHYSVFPLLVWMFGVEGPFMRVVCCVL